MTFPSKIADRLQLKTMSGPSEFKETGQEYIEEYPPRKKSVLEDGHQEVPSPGPSESTRAHDDGLVRKRAPVASDLPENMTLDEVEAAKRPKVCSMIQHPSGKFDSRGRPIPGMASMPMADEEEEAGSPPEKETDSPPPDPPDDKSSERSKKIYVGGMPPFFNEDTLKDHFSRFGKIVHCQVVRRMETGISRGFAFLTFSRGEEANDAVLHLNHSIDGRQVRVSFAQDGATDRDTKSYGPTRNQILDSMVLPNQSRVYMGPLDDQVTVNDVTKQFSQYGTVTGVSRLKSSETSVKQGFGFVEYKEGMNAVGRAFGAKVFVKGKHVYVALSRMAIELILSHSVVFFYDAHLFCDEDHLEQHFRRYGQVFRAIHLPSLDHPGPEHQEREKIPNKSYGFVDFVHPRAVDSCTADKNQLLYPGQYIRTGSHLPQILTLDFLAISDQQGIAIKKKLEKVTLDQGCWGDSKKVQGEGATTSQVRIPSSMIARLIGERGRSIAEITRDSKTKIQIPRTDPSEPHAIISITGKREDIRTAQYLMQRLLKGQR